MGAIELYCSQCYRPRLSITYRFSIELDYWNYFRRGPRDEKLIHMSKRTGRDRFFDDLDAIAEDGLNCDFARYSGENEIGKWRRSDNAVLYGKEAGVSSFQRESIGQ